MLGIVHFCASKCSLCHFWHLTIALRTSLLPTLRMWPLTKGQSWQLLTQMLNEFEELIKMTLRTLFHSLSSDFSTVVLDQMLGQPTSFSRLSQSPESFTLLSMLWLLFDSQHDSWHGLWHSWSTCGWPGKFSVTSTKHHKVTPNISQKTTKLFISSTNC